MDFTDIESYITNLEESVTPFDTEFETVFEHGMKLVEDHTNFENCPKLAQAVSSIRDTERECLINEPRILEETIDNCVKCK
jgi:hypothetical protein